MLQHLGVVVAELAGKKRPLPVLLPFSDCIAVGPHRAKLKNGKLNHRQLQDCTASSFHFGMTLAKKVIGRFDAPLLALRLADNTESAEVQRCSESAAHSGWESLSIGRPISPPNGG
jgi:hypothetical protein